LPEMGRTISGKDGDPASLMIRPLRAEDRDALAVTLGPANEDAPVPGPAEDLDAWMNQVLRNLGEQTFVVELSNGKLVGITRIAFLSAWRRTGELSYWIAPPERRLGYGTDAVRLTCERAWQRLQLRELDAFVRESNSSSMRILAKCGFEERETRRTLDGQRLRKFSLVRPATREAGMKIRKDQVESFRQEGAGPVVDQFKEEVRREYPDACAGMDEDELDDRMYLAVSRAWDYGLYREEQMRAFVKLRFCVSHGFDEHPRFRQILASDVDPDLKLELLFHNASSSDWRAAAKVRPGVA
jgi:RimJ/RimL family protein N-acetyltransferase